MAEIRIRKALPENLDRIMVIYAAAKRFMDQTGNPTQWKIGYPAREMIQKDIQDGYCYVCEGADNEIHGVFYFRVGEDPTYRVIEDGAWPNQEPYGTFHRVASDGSCRGILSRIVSYCIHLCPQLRADTHHDNHVMQHLLEKNGFVRCGIIYVEDGTPRIAYQLSENRYSTIAK